MPTASRACRRKGCRCSRGAWWPGKITPSSTPTGWRCTRTRRRTASSGWSPSVMSGSLPVTAAWGRLSAPSTTTVSSASCSSATRGFGGTPTWSRASGSPSTSPRTAASSRAASRSASRPSSTRTAPKPRSKWVRRGPYAPDMEGLIAQGLRKRFRNRVVVDRVSLDIQRGEVVGLLGPNGAGKTTSFYMIVGLLRADGGRIFLEGREVTDLPMYKRCRLGMGYLPQESSVFRKLTVEENLLAILETLDISHDERRDRLKDLLAELDLTRLARHKAYTLSGGERRRLEITRALVTNPRYLLLDEPFTGIDPIAIGDIQEIVARLKERGIGVLITDHNVRETLAITDRAYILHNGKILASGTASELANNPQAREIYLGEKFSL